MSNENIDPTYANIYPKSGNCIYSYLETISNLTDVPEFQVILRNYFYRNFINYKK